MKQDKNNLLVRSMATVDGCILLAAKGDATITKEAVHEYT
jgi:hypothetical protein